MQLTLGDVSVTTFSVGELRADLRAWLRLTDQEAAARPELAEPVAIPIQCVLLELPGTTILVDAGAYDPSDPDFRLPNYTPPPGLAAQLGSRAEQVDHVVITHAHFDHFLGAVTDGAPTFPNARYYLGAGDWGSAHPVFEALRSHGVLERVEGRRELVPGILVEPSPGETPGHQSLNVRSQLYCVGDLYHHMAEVECPEWMAWWADRETTLASRAALDSEALLVAAHIPQAFRLGQKPQARP